MKLSKYKFPEEVNVEGGEGKAKTKPRGERWPGQEEEIWNQQQSTRKVQHPTRLLLQITVSDRATANTKWAKVSSVLQAHAYVTSELCERDPPLCRIFYPINKSGSIILYQNNILAFNEHNCQYPESHIINHYLLLPTLSNFLLRRQGWVGSLIWIRNTVTRSALHWLTLCGRAGSVGVLLSIQLWVRGRVQGRVHGG